MPGDRIPADRGHAAPSKKRIDGRSPTLPEKFATAATRFAGSSWAFALAMVFLLGWALCGPLFRFSEDWQLVVNTGTTIITFLMVFLIQRAQNKDAHALHLKLNELIAAMQGASNRLLNLEDLSESQLETLHKHFDRLARLAAEEDDVTRSHSVEEAEARHKSKSHGKPRRAAG